jgi:phage tail sheath gpL-like
VNLKYKFKSAETPFIMQLAGVSKIEIDICSNQYHHTKCDVTNKSKVHKLSTKLLYMWVFVRERETICVPVPGHSCALSTLQLKAKQRYDMIYFRFIKC